MNNTQNKIKSFLKGRPIIAIAGGAGPDAAIDLQIKLLCAMKKKLNISFDQEHYRVIVDNNTDLPNRDEALLSNGPSPLLMYMDSAKKLEKMGGDILIISCNTAHAYFDDIQKITSMKMINMFIYIFVTIFLASGNILFATDSSEDIKGRVNKQQYTKKCKTLSCQNLSSQLEIKVEKIDSNTIQRSFYSFWIFFGSSIEYFEIAPLFEKNIS